MKHLKLSLALGAGLFLSSCAHHVFNIPTAVPTGDKKEISATANALKGGKNSQNFECDTGMIKQVEIRQNIGQSLLNIITLGTVFSLDVTYDCAKIVPPDGEL